MNDAHVATARPGFGRGLLLGSATAVALWAVYVLLSNLIFDQLMWDNTVVPLVAVLTVVAVVVAIVRARLRRAALGFAVALPIVALLTFIVIAFVAIFFFGI